MPRRGVDLSEEQWRIVKSHAAERGQTISAFFGDVIMELGLGRAKEPDGSLRDYPPPQTTTTSRTTSRVDITSPDPTAMPRSIDDEDFIRPVNTGSFGASRPAPKPARKK